MGKLLRRAITIQRKVEELTSLVNANYGIDSYPADMADNLMVAASDMIEALERRSRSNQVMEDGKDV